MPYNHISYRDRGKERKVSDILAEADSLWNYGERALGKWDDVLWPWLQDKLPERAPSGDGVEEMEAAGKAEQEYNASVAKGFKDAESSRRGESTGGSAAHEAWKKARAEADAERERELARLLDEGNASFFGEGG